MSDVFREYDIRGKYPDEIDEDFSRRLGRALGSLVEGDTGVGRDTRRESAQIESPLRQGIREGGSNPVSIEDGPVPSALNSHYSSETGNPSVNVTASHNPPGYTGLKVTDSKGVGYADWNGIRELMEGVPPNGSGEERYESWIGDYIETITDGLSSDLEIVVDSIGGAGTVTGPFALEEIGAEPVPIYEEFSATFHGRRPEPEPEGLDELKRTVRERGAAMGVAYDGDADRAVFVDEEGEPTDSQQIAWLLSENLPDGPRVLSIDCSNLLDEGNVVWSPVGHTHIEERMVSEGAVFGAEQSSHFYFSPDDYFPASDGVLATLRLADALEGRTLSEALSDAPEPSMIKGNIEVDGDEKGERFREIEEELRETHTEAEVIDVDGIRLNYDDSWLLVRPSSTEPKIRYTIEAPTEEEARDIRERTGVLP